MVLPQTRLAALEAREDYAGSEVTVRLLCCKQYMKQNEGGTPVFPHYVSFVQMHRRFVWLGIDLQGEKKLK